MSADKSFRGTLLLLQNKTKRDPESYSDEFRTQLKHFEAVCKTLISSPGASSSSRGAVLTELTSASNPQFLAVMHFISQVAHCYSSECAALPQMLIDLLHCTKDSLPVDSRAAIVNSLLLLRGKNLATAQQTLPVLFELLQNRDKGLRKTILGHIVSDIRRINLPGAKSGSSAVNKHIQNFLFKIMDDDDPVQARCALTIMIDLYRRQLWCNEKTVSVITKACFSRHTLITRMALHFFLLQMPKFSSVGSDDERDSEIDPGRLISKLKHKLKHKSKTVHREKVLKSKVDLLKKRFDADKREEEAMSKQQVDPIRLLIDPQGFAERLLAKLLKTTERFEVRLLFMSVMSRVINEHDLIVLGVYPLFERYLEPTQIHATNILALASTCVHRLVPPESIESMVRTIADRFVNDRSDKDSITIGLNTIREICKRQPLAMNTDLLTDLVAYRQRRGDRGVIMAARALLQLYREVHPELLPPKLRGVCADPGNRPQFGVEPPLRDIPGLEALFGAADDIANSQDLVESALTSSDDTSADGEWQLVSDDTDDEDDTDVGTTAEESEEDDVPQLVPILHTKRHDDLEPTSKLANDERTRGERSAAPHRGKPESALVPDKSGFVAADDLWTDSSSDVAPSSKRSRPERRSPSRSGSEVNDAAAASDESEDGSDESSVEEMTESSADDDSFTEDSDDTGSGEWVNVPDTGNDIDEISPENEPSPAWFEHVHSAKPAHASSSSIKGTGSVATMRILSDVEFAQLRNVAQKGNATPGKKLAGKAVEKAERASRKDALIHAIGEKGTLLDPSVIEAFSSKKRARDREMKVEEARTKRMENNPFQARKKRKTKLTTTHREKQKAGKLYQMTKRSGRVAEKIKRSVSERQDRAKDMKKKNIKFRIARGWKA